MQDNIIGKLTSSSVIKRYEGNPILKASDVPYKTDLVLNAGVTKFQGKYIMVFRNDIRVDEHTVSEGVNLGIAYSDDGIKWEVQSKPCFDMHNEELDILKPIIIQEMENAYKMDVPLTVDLGEGVNWLQAH